MKRKLFESKTRRSEKWSALAQHVYVVASSRLLGFGRRMLSLADLARLPMIEAECHHPTQRAEPAAMATGR